jgi:endonuclease G
VPLPRGAARLLLWFNLAVAGLIGGWYVCQPDSRQAEVRRLVGNLLTDGKHVTAFDVAWDIWQLYYADAGAGRVAPGDKAIVYGGPPRAVGRPADAGPVRLLQNQGYLVGYSDVLETPLWAAYHVRDLARIPVPKPRPEKFEVDRRTAARVGPELYSDSGYDRGHLAPNYAIATRYGTAAQRETFLMSNVTPQRHALNAGLWRDLELKLATSYPARYGEIWAIVGPVFGAQPKKLRGRVPVADAFFLIVIDEAEGRLRTLALIVPHDAPGDADPSRYLTSIAEVQRRTGLDFLTELDDAAERAVESARAARVW